MQSIDSKVMSLYNHFQGSDNTMPCKTCFFIGHHNASEAIRDELNAAIQNLILLGITDFVVGNYGAFDRLVANVLGVLKQQYPKITVTMLTAYHPYTRPFKLEPPFDSSFYPPGLEAVPKRYAIVRANQYMAKNADYLIAYVNNPASNSRKLLEYAQNHHVNVINLGKYTPE